jgi:hypothetical protein
VILAHAALPFHAFALQPARPWRLLAVGLVVVLGAEWVSLLLTVYWPRPQEWDSEWAGVALFVLVLFTPAYALASALIVAMCVATRRRFLPPDQPAACSGASSARPTAAREEKWRTSSRRLAFRMPVSRAS